MAHEGPHSRVYLHRLLFIVDISNVHRWIAPGDFDRTKQNCRFRTFLLMALEKGTLVCVPLTKFRVYFLQNSVPGSVLCDVYTDILAKHMQTCLHDSLQMQDAGCISVGCIT